jgi:solute carrier family 25 (adenine nucleotide translocator) protein 4/5/6/31
MIPNLASLIRYIPMQAMNFAFKDYFKTLFPKSKNDSNIKKLFQNTVSGGLAGVVAVTGTCLNNF